MNETNGDNQETDLEEADETSSTGKIPDIGGDTMVDVTAELKVDKLVAKIDSIDPNEAAHAREVRKRLEELRDKKNEDLDSTFNFNLDEDI